MTHPVSGYMLVLNEFRCIQASVRCLSRYCDDVLIVDGGSSDGTQDELSKLARELDNVRFLVWPQRSERYSEHWREPLRRNWASKACMHDWVLTIDADELLPDLPEDFFFVRDEPLIFDTLNLLTRSEVIIKVEAKDGIEIWYPDSRVRFFNRTCARYTERPLHCVLETENREVLIRQAKHTGAAVFHYHALVNPDRQWNTPEMRNRLVLEPLRSPAPSFERFLRL